MAFKMKGNPYKMGTMATKSTMMKAEESAMKMKKESAMKKYASDAQRRAVHASKAESAMKMGRKSPAKKGHEDPKEGSYTTHGNPSKYTTASGKSVDSANIDEGNLSTVKTGSDGRKFVTVQDDTAKFKAGTKLYISSSATKMKKKSPAKMKKSSATKMKKGSAMKLSEADKKKAIANALPDAEVSTISKDTMREAKALGLMVKGESGGWSFDQRKARKAISDVGDWRTDKEAMDKKQNIRRLMKAFS
tara:strand:+ start:468 stop:1211 length:744 start_codon:yes stop_codon:yes gene_type:complete